MWKHLKTQYIYPQTTQSHGPCLNQLCLIVFNFHKVNLPNRINPSQKQCDELYWLLRVVTPTDSK